jgi:hypothetical protein
VNVSSEGRAGMIGPAKSVQKKCATLDQLKTLPDRSPSQLRKSKGGVVYQHDAAKIFRGKNTIFELTHMVKAASCRPYPEKLSGL